MFRLTEKLSQTEPEQARRLERALRESGELLIRHHMDQAVESLEKAQLAEATEHQAAAEKALEKILTLLTETGDDALERQRELDRMNELREQVDKLLDKQLQLRSRTDPSEQIARKLADAAAQVQKLIDRQAAELERARQADASQADELSESQSNLREDTEKVAGDLNQPTTRPSADPLSHAADQAKRDLQDAADQMRAAEKQLGEGKPADAQPGQNQAMKSLQKALEALKKASSNANPLDPAEAAKQQQALEKEAGKLADSMHDEQAKPGSESKPSGEQSPDSQPDSQPDSESQPTPGENGPNQQEPGDSQSAEPSSPSKPGADNVRRAQNHMKQAGQKLQSGKPSQATPEQDKAIEELEQAQAELQETLDQLRREQQEEMLAGLEQRFRAMLLEQQAVNTSTADLDARKESWTRTDSLNLAALAEKQTALSGEAAKALNILVEEGTTVVFPQIVTQVRDDMTDVAKRLGEKQTGPITRGIQNQIVETLQELIAAIEQRQKDGPPPAGDQAGGQQPGQPQETPLLPSSAELKLLRSSQLRINTQTDTLEKAATQSPAEVGNEATRLSERQEQLADMARKINERGERK